MILIDSLYINGSGGLALLRYLIDTLQSRGHSFYLLADKRCEGLFDGQTEVEYMKPTLMRRYMFYLKRKSSFSSVMCFGNIPPPVKLEIPSYTYFHNINLLTLDEAHTMRKKLMSWLKRQVFRFYKKNTTLWLVQTDNTFKELTCHLKEPASRVRILPFYKLPAKLLTLKSEEHGDDYAFISNYTGAKGHEELLLAWTQLHNKGIDRTLHLTVPKEESIFVKKIEKAQSDGVKIINHGFIPFDQVLELYKKSKAIVYPSHNESLGLSIIEAVEAGCDVIGADLPYLHSICKPSCIFDPYNPVSIADAVEAYEENLASRTQILICDKIQNVINLISNNNDSI